MIIAFNKPFQVLSQFTSPDGKATLADYIGIKGIYVAGRLDYDSEGLLLLTDDGRLQHKISHPKHKAEKSYWAQLDGAITSDAINQLNSGVQLKDGPAVANVSSIQEPNIWARVPPIRVRKNIPTSWIELTIKEGRNRQVRRMTAAVGFPTLRLIRQRIGDCSIDNIAPGQHIQINPSVLGLA